MRHFSLSTLDTMTERRSAHARDRLEADVQGLSAVLERDGVKGALRFLNQRTVHRLTAVYRFDGDDLVNEQLYDREDPFAKVQPPGPISASYCRLVRETNGSITISNARLDERVTDHPKRETIGSYVGASIPNADGTPYGSLCHYDPRPHVFSDLDLDLLTEAARLLGDYFGQGRGRPVIVMTVAT